MNNALLARETGPASQPDMHSLSSPVPVSRPGADRPIPNAGEKRFDASGREIHSHLPRTFSHHGPRSAVLSTVRLVYAKRGKAVFSSHLDIINLFHSAVLRAQLPLAFTQGFNPKPRLAFGPPCPVGVYSECEIVDLSLSTRMDPEALLAKLRPLMPPGFALRSASPLENGARLPDSLVGGHRYVAMFKIPLLPDEDASRCLAKPLEEAAASILAATTLEVADRGPKGPRNRDLRPYIGELVADPNEAGGLRFSLLRLGTSSVRPSLLLDLLEARIREILSRDGVVLPEIVSETARYAIVERDNDSKPTLRDAAGGETGTGHGIPSSEAPEAA